MATPTTFMLILNHYGDTDNIYDDADNIYELSAHII